jgi:hypothetical protein
MTPEAECLLPAVGAGANGCASFSASKHFRTKSSLCGVLNRAGSYFSDFFSPFELYNCAFMVLQAPEIRI